jgi:hypothetical protein
VWCGKAGFQTLVKRKMNVSHWPAILIGKAEFCTCHKANKKGHEKANQKKYQRKCKTENLHVTFQVNQKKLTYQMKGKKKKGPSTTRNKRFQLG